MENTLQEILDTMHDSDLFPRTGKDAPSRFWAAYERVANQHDVAFLERHNSDLDVLLIFVSSIIAHYELSESIVAFPKAGLFSAISSAFIVNMSSLLVPQPSDTTNALLMILINKVANGTFSDQDASLPVWTGPGSTIIWIQSLAYTSLSTSLLAAAGAVLGKQWLGHFKSTRLGRGSLEERCTRRQQKYNGLKRWHFHAIISFLPILLQLSLVFFGISLAGNIWLLQPSVAAVIMSTTALGISCYIFTVVASFTSPDCPFVTPVSSFIRRLHRYVMRVLRTLSKASESWLPYPLRFYFTNTVYTITGLRTRLRTYFTRMVSLLTLNSRLLNNNPESTEDSYNMPSKDVLNMDLPPADPVRAHAVQWILDTSTDVDIITTAAKMLLEIEWPYGYDIAAVADRLKGHFMACFDPSNQALPSAESRALACMNAIVHCSFKGDLPIPFLPSGHQGLISYFDSRGIIYYKPSEQGLRVINSVLNIYPSTATDITSLSSSERMWIAHMCSFGLHYGHDAPDWEDFVVDFMGECLHDMDSPPRLVADCLLSAALMMGLKVDLKQLAKLDKRYGSPCNI